ncbi:hypothetical protein ZHAS_00008674 [Anopheles sinensis]|uniref:Uncharacterized protein n=1 Tax=Anopheles sinensis TaxID=74873 RepID=A0A084VSV8_ANOSI|nr:hypothetical protein ZHAS_00008674 [Anopheles sinensis]
MDRTVGAVILVITSVGILSVLQSPALVSDFVATTSWASAAAGREEAQAMPALLQMAEHSSQALAERWVAFVAWQ